jgi:hypothetical protein
MISHKKCFIAQLTAAMEGLLSSPGCGWVTSAPNMMVGLSVTKGMRLDTASTSTVFLPPTFERKSVGFNKKKCNKNKSRVNENQP